MFSERNLDGLGTELARVDRIAGKRRPAEDDLVACVEYGL